MFYDGRPLVDNTIYTDDFRLAVILRPLYQTSKEKFIVTVGRKQYKIVGQPVAFVLEAGSEGVQVDVASIHLSTDCEPDIPIRGVSRLQDSDFIRDRIASVPAQRRRDPAFDAFHELRIREENRPPRFKANGTIDYAPYGPGAPKEQPLTAIAGISVPPGEVVMFELVYSLPDCYSIMQDMTLTISGLRVGGQPVDALAVDVTKREHEYTIED